MNARFRLNAYLAAVALSLSPCAGAAESVSTAAILAGAPSFQVLLDNSGSSPALDPALMESVAPVIAERLMTMPVGTLVTVTNVGDARMAAAMLRMRIEARGATAGEIARKLQRYLHDYPAQMRGKEQGRSDLVGGFAAAAAYVNRQSSANEIWFVTDLVEYSTVADCSRARRCALPAKPAFDLGGAHVHVYGVGQGLPSAQAMQLTEDWRAFLARAKAGDAELRRF